MNLADGDEITVKLGSAEHRGRIEERFLGPAPERRTALFVNIPLRMPIALSEVVAMGATVERAAGT